MLAAENEAKRRLIAIYEQAVLRQAADGQNPDLPAWAAADGRELRGYVQGLSLALHLASTPYDDHPDYRPAWALYGAD